MLKIGIIGNGGIVRSLFEEVAGKGVLAATAILVRPGSREKGEALAQEFGIATVYTELEAFLQDDSYDFVYVAVANSLHYEYTKACLKAGRHVICEKPFTDTAAQLAELIALAGEKDLYLFEAITLLHSPNFPKIQEALPKLGTLKLVQTNFGQYSSRYDRYLQGDVAPAFAPALGGGALRDLGIYNIHFIVGLFGRPEKVTYYANRGFNGVDTSGLLVLEYEGFIATSAAAKDSASDNYAILQGEGGTMTLNMGNECRDVCLSCRSGDEHIDEPWQGRMTQEMIAFGEIYTREDYPRMRALLDHSLAVMEVLEAATRA